MSRMLKRPAYATQNNKGMLQHEQFQIAYATNDIARAKEQFSKRFGISNYQQLGGQMPAGGDIQVELAWVGNTMYELVSASGPGSEVFNRHMPEQGFSLHLHHLGFLIETESEWQALQSTAAEQGLQKLSENNNEGFMRHCFYELEGCGHFLEYIFPEPAGLAFLQQVPAN